MHISAQSYTNFSNKRYSVVNYYLINNKVFGVVEREGRWCWDMWGALLDEGDGVDGVDGVDG